jgi:hypothetical protein
MGFEGLLKTLAEKFNETQIRYALIGGIAMHTAGYHRSTGDLDFLVHGEDVEQVKSLLNGLGYKLIHESPDVLNFMSPWVLIGGVDFIKAHRPYALAMLQRAKVVRVSDGVDLLTAAVEDIIGLKVQAMQNDPGRKMKDVADIEWLVKNHKNMDMVLIEEYFRLFSLQDEYRMMMERCRNAQ